MAYIPYGLHSVDKKDLRSILKINKSNVYTNGEYLIDFENQTKKYLGSNYSIAVNSGTSAIHLAYKAINLKQGDNIIMPSVNFIASYSMAKLCGANIYLADIDYKTGQMSPEKIKECIKKNKLKKIKAFVAMYLGGSPEYINEFFKLKKKLNCYFIEDACHAFGSSYKIKNKTYMTGSCKHSDISTFSFHPVKTITTGEGGLITTNNFKFCKKIKEQRSHGIIRNSNKHWLYKIKETSFNYRISEINCLLGISQLKKIKKFINKRILLSSKYKKELILKTNLVKSLELENSNLSAWHLFIILIDFKKLRINKNDFIGSMLKHKIVLQQHYIPIYRLLNLKNKKQISFPNADKYFKNALSLPLFNDLTFSKQKYIITKIIKFINYAAIKKRTK